MAEAVEETRKLAAGKPDRYLVRRLGDVGWAFLAGRDHARALSIMPNLNCLLIRSFIYFFFMLI